MICNQCGSSKVFHNLRVLDRVSQDSNSDLALETHLRPHALFLTDAISIPLVANVCRTCGHVMFSLRSKNDLDKIEEAAEAMEAVDSSDDDINSSPGFGSYLGGGSKEKSE